MARKRWIRPQLIVLGRGTPQESVLAGCKITGVFPTGQTTTFTGCLKRNAGKTACTGAVCSVNSKS